MNRPNDAFPVMGLCARLAAMLLLATACGADESLEELAETETETETETEAAEQDVELSDARSIVSPALALRITEVPRRQPTEVSIHIEDPVSHHLDGPPTFARGVPTDEGDWSLFLDGRPAEPHEFVALNEELRANILAAQTSKREARRVRLQVLVDELGWDDAQMQEHVRAGNGWFRRALTRDEVETIAASEELPIRWMDVPQPIETGLTGANDSMGTTSWAHPYGYEGDGVGVWIRDDGHPDPTNPAIDPDRVELIPSYPGPGTNHPTQVALSFASAAPEATLYSADGNDSCLTRNDLARYSNPPIYLSTHSWSWTAQNPQYGECDRVWENWVYENRISTFFLSHNQGNFVTTPGKAYNIITVGAYNSYDDTMPSFSNFRNPETEAEKPDIVAPGVGLSIPTFSGGIGGTSIATPLAAGFAADLMSSSGGQQVLQYQPALMKAFLVAGAVRDIDTSSAPLSDKDGAGAIDYLNTQFNRGWAWWGGGNGDFFDADDHIHLSEDLVAGNRYRISVAWLVPGDYVLANKKPNMNIDLRVFRGRSMVAESDSSTNAFELVDFVAPSTGTYDVVIDRTWNSGVGNVLMGYTVGPVSTP